MERRTRNAERIMPYAERGFTLLEVLVTLAILGVALVVIIQLFSTTTRAIGASEEYVMATARAEAEMRDVLGGEELAEKSWSARTDDGYTVDVAITEKKDDRTENLQVKLLDVHLTLKWRSGMKDRSLSLDTLKLVQKKI